MNSPVIQTINGQRYLTLEIDRFLPPPDVSLGIEVSGNLRNWQPAEILSTMPSHLRARAPLSLNLAPGQFIRVRATRP